MGVLELVGALEKEFGIELDMSGMDTEQLTIIGPLAKYVARTNEQLDSDEVRVSERAENVPTNPARAGTCGGAAR